MEILQMNTGGLYSVLRDFHILTETESELWTRISDYNHFSRLFKKYNGCSAREYRVRYQ